MAEYLAGSVGGQPGRLVFGGRFAVVVGVVADTEPKEAVRDFDGESAVPQPD